MKGKTIAIAVFVLTIVAVAAIYFLVMATFKNSEQDRGSSMGSPVPIESMGQSYSSR